MLVQWVVLPASPFESWVVLGDDDAPVTSIEWYLVYLTDLEWSPNTIKGYAHDLKDWFTFLAGRGLDWWEVRLGDIGEFVAWLRLPPMVRDGTVTVLPLVECHGTGSTVNRRLSALSAFYTHAAGHGIDGGELLVPWRPAGRRGGGWKPFLHHVSKGIPAAWRAIVLTVSKKLPRVLTAGEVQAILDACEYLRDRFLFAVWYDSGCRIGEALGLRHEDLAAAEGELTICRGDNDSGARSKSVTTPRIPGQC